MNYYSNNIRHVRGDTYSFGLVSENEQFDSVYFTCRNGLNDNSPVLFQKSLINGIGITETEETQEGTLYKYSVRIDPTDTEDINSGTYYYDLQVELNGDIFSIMKGRFIIEQDCTRNEIINDEIVLKINEINGEIVGVSTLDKLNYLEATKGLIKDSLNDFGAGISDNDTFRSYSGAIDSLYDYMKQTTNEGTEVTLSNTRVAKMKITPKGNTTQKTTTGKQLFNINNVQEYEGSTSNYNGKVEFINNGFRFTKTTEAGDGKGRFTKAISCNLSAGTYIITGNLVVSDNSSSLLMNISSPNVSLSNGTINKVFTIDTDITEFSFYFNGSVGQNVYAEFTNIMIRSSSITDDTYEPYTNGPSPNPDYPQGIKLVTGDNIITISNSDDSETKTQTISLDDIELCKIGTYQDYIYKNNENGKWYKKKLIEKLILTGNEGWSNAPNSENRSFRISNNDVVSAESGVIGPILSNEYIADTQSRVQSTNINYGVSVRGSGNEGIVIRNKDIDGKDNFILYLSTKYDNNNPVIIYYAKVTPQDIEITDTTLISQLNLVEKLTSYEGTTVITSIYDEDNAQMILTATALTN